MQPSGRAGLCMLSVTLSRSAYPAPRQQLPAASALARRALRCEHFPDRAYSTPTSTAHLGPQLRAIACIAERTCSRLVSVARTVRAPQHPAPRGALVPHPPRGFRDAFESSCMQRGRGTRAVRPSPCLPAMQVGWSPTWRRPPIPILCTVTEEVQKSRYRIFGQI